MKNVLYIPVFPCHEVSVEDSNQASLRFVVYEGDSRTKLRV